MSTMKRKLSGTSEGGTVHKPVSDPYYDELAKDIFSTLGRKQGSKQYKALDSIYVHPENGATVYIGNIHASRSQKLLETKNISAIVNCTADGRLSFENQENSKGVAYKYLRFSIAQWPKFFHSRAQTPESVLEYVNQMIDFVEDSLDEGHSVLIHCLAGAHRAGTTGVLYLMAKHDISKTRATKLAKELRPIIDPIGTLKDLLQLVEDSRDAIREDDATSIRHWK